MYTGTVQPLLEAFLLRTSSLKHLRLNFQHVDQGATDYVFEHFSLANNLLPNLERLEFGMMTTTPDLLLQLFSYFSATLRYIGLWKVSLAHSVLPRWFDAESRFNPWPSLFKNLSRMSALRLSGITVGLLAQSDRSTLPHNFLPLTLPNGKISQEFSGDMTVFMPRLIDGLRVVRPPEREESEDEDGHGDEDEEMGEDEEEDEDEDE
jgi:hypothetical protein